MKNYIITNIDKFLLKEDVETKVENPIKNWEELEKKYPSKQIEDNVKEITVYGEGSIYTTTKKLSERGPSLDNKAVMDLSDADLDAKIKGKATDSLRLEKSWRLINSNVDEALKNGEVKIGDDVIADNIKMKDDKVVFNFTFKDSDSKIPKEKNNGKVPYTTQILAGSIKEEKIPIAAPPVKKVYAILIKLSTRAVFDTSNIGQNMSEEDIEKIYQKLYAAGFRKQEGTYKWFRNDTNVWLPLQDTEEGLKFIEEFFNQNKNNKPYYDYKGNTENKKGEELYKKYIQKYIQKAK